MPTTTNGFTPAAGLAGLVTLALLALATSHDRPPAPAAWPPPPEPRDAWYEPDASMRWFWAEANPFGPRKQKDDKRRRSNGWPPPGRRRNGKGHRGACRRG